MNSTWMYLVIWWCAAQMEAPARGDEHCASIENLTSMCPLWALTSSSTTGACDLPSFFSFCQGHSLDIQPSFWTIPFRIRARVLMNQVFNWVELRFVCFINTAFSSLDG